MCLAGGERARVRDTIVGNSTVEQISACMCVCSKTLSSMVDPSVSACLEQGETGTFDMYKDERIKAGVGRELSNIWD